MSNPFKPKVPTVPTPAAPAVAAPSEKPKELSRQESSSRTEAKSKRKGRSALRIDLQGGSAGSEGTGINIPQK
jgi:hypothetical protein